METPEWLRQLAETAVQEHPADIAQAVACLEARARQEPDFAALTAALVTDSLLHLVYDVRHTFTEQVKRPEPYLGRPKVDRTRSPTLRAAQRGMMRYFIGGTVLANIKGKDMEALAEKEESLAGGHLLNARILRRLRALTPDEATAGEKVSDRKFEKILREEQARSDAA